MSAYPEEVMGVTDSRVGHQTAQLIRDVLRFHTGQRQSSRSTTLVKSGNVELQQLRTLGAGEADEETHDEAVT
jgi:hypothetical protein